MHVLSPDIPDSFPAREVFGRASVRLCIAIMIGIALAAAVGYQWAGLLIAGGMVFGVAGLVLSKHSLGPWFLLASVVSCSAGWTTWRVAHAPSDSLIRVLNDGPVLLQLEGRATNQPLRSMGSLGAFAESLRFAPPSVRFRFEVDRSLDANGLWIPASGTFYASVSAAEQVDFEAGDRIRLLGMASPLRTPGNPGAHDPRPGAMQRGIVGSIRISNAEAIEVIQPAKNMSGLLERTRAHAIDRLEAAGERSGHRQASALLGALLLGERGGSEIRPLEEAFTRTGVGHFLAISGLHVGMVLVGIAYLVRLTGDRPRLEAALVIVAALLLVAFIPARPPVLRAVLIALALILSHTSGRSYDRLSVLALVASGLLIYRPIDLFNPGFQLTFAVVAALIVCTSALRTWIFGERERSDELRGMQWLWRWFKDAAAVSVCASAVSAPLIALHFGVFSPFAALLSVLLMPLVALILGTGYAALLLGALIPSLLDGLIEMALQPAVWLAESVRWLDAQPGVAFYLPSISWPLAFAMLAVVIWWMFPSYTSERKRRIATALVILPIAWSTIVGPAIPRSQALRLDMLDVGDGTSILLRSGRHSMLYDCGSLWLGIGEREIPRAVRTLGAGRVDTVIVSHPDLDHFSGLLDAARPLGVRRVLVAQSFIEQASQEPERAPAFLLRRLSEMGIRVDVLHRGDRINLGDLELEVLHPDREDRPVRDNDASLVLRLRTGEAAGAPTVLLLGDIEREAMQLLESREPDLRGQIIEVPHHGSARSFAYPFVEWLNPDILLQSTGPSRLLDERWDTVRAGRQWFTTASDGAITVIIGRDGSITTRTYR